MPFFTVIVPIYNVESCLRRCIDSILCQTFGDFELILVDDGSTDECGTICDEYRKTEHRILVIHKENGGLSSARNAGLKKAEGKYVYFCDSDDWIEPNLLERVYEEAKHDYDSIVFGFEKDADTVRQYVYDETLFEDCHNFDFICNTFLNWKIAWSACTRVYKNKIIKKYHLNFADNRKIFAEDLYFSLVYYSHSRNCKVIEDCLYHYVLRNNSIMDKQKGILNVNRMNELSKEVKAHLFANSDCKDFLVFYPIIHMLIIFNVLERSIEIYGEKRLYSLIKNEVVDQDYFYSSINSFINLWKAYLKNTKDYNALYKLVLFKYIKSGNYSMFALRSALIKRSRIRSLIYKIAK